MAPRDIPDDAGLETPGGWTLDSWRSKISRHQIDYEDSAELQRVVSALRNLPPLVTSWEIERLKALIADAQEGKRFLLQGGDCAETLADCTPDTIASKLKILLQMSLVLVYGSKQPVIRVGRIAGQYAKPRSSPTETRSIDGYDVALPSYFGDAVNAQDFNESSRRPNPGRLLEGYKHAALTLNFIRSLMQGGFADLHHPEYWELEFLTNAALPPPLRKAYQHMVERVSEGLRFTEAVGERSISEFHRAEFFASHEGLNLHYECSQTRRVPHRSGVYNLTTHLPWIGERTRQLDGPHVEYFRGIANPVGVKIGPGASPDDTVKLIQTLNPDNMPGKIVLVTRFGADRVEKCLPSLIEAAMRAGLQLLWVCDPMHGNTTTTTVGVKTRDFDRIRSEIEGCWNVHAALGSRLGGLHVELTGEDVTECTGGVSGLTEADLAVNYGSACDPRLNYQQSIELALLLARHMQTNS